MLGSRKERDPLAGASISQEPGDERGAFLAISDRRSGLSLSGVLPPFAPLNRLRRPRSARPDWPLPRDRRSVTGAGAVTAYPWPLTPHLRVTGAGPFAVDMLLSVDGIERRPMRMSGVRLLLEVAVGFAISIAMLTGLLYVATRDLFEDSTWPPPAFVWLGIGGAILGLAALKWLDSTESGAPGRSWRSRLARPGWLVGALLAVVIWSTLFTMMTTGGPAYPGDMVLGGIRNAIRATWATLTGQSHSADLFPF